MKTVKGTINGDAQMSEAEKKDSFIVKKIYEQLKGEDLYYKDYPKYSYCDCYSEITQNNKRFKWNTEIKTNNKEGYNNFLLKVDKKERMFDFTPDDCGLFLIYLNCDKKAYIYNCRTLDWNYISVKSIRQLVRNVQPELGYTWYDTYFIPKDKAIKVIDYSKFEELYELYRD